MRRNARRLLLLLALTTLFAPALRAWDSVGHETVAAIAWDTMKPATRTKVSAILNAAQAGDCLQELGAGGDPRAFFIRAATWPDVVRPDKRKKDQNGNPIPDTRPCTKFHQAGEHFNDHYWAGTSGGADGSAPQDRPVPASKQDGLKHNAVERLISFYPIVVYNNPPCSVTPEERARDLAWIIHLVGDVNQPLHNASRITSDHPDGDEGGNLFSLSADPKKPANLHGFWDDAIDKTIPRNPGEDEIAYIDRIAKRITSDHPAATLASRIESGQFAAWSAEGFATAERLAYPETLHLNETPNPAYRAQVFKTADEAIALAGYRLADFLDHALN